MAVPRSERHDRTPVHDLPLRKQLRKNSPRVRITVDAVAGHHDGAVRNVEIDVGTGENVVPAMRLVRFLD